MKIAIVDRPDLELRIENGTLRFDTHRLPLRHIDIMIVSTTVSMHPKQISAIVAEGVSILFVDEKNRMVLCQNSAAKNSEVKAAQYSAYHHAAFSIARRFLSEKIVLHCSHLRRMEIFVDEKEYEERIDNAGELQTLLGIEGSFSKKYFQEFFSRVPKAWHKGVRSKRPPEDPFNALLSFSYSLIYYLCASRLIAMGFEPGIGYLHRPFRDHFALASDMVELFRAQVNEWALECVSSGEIELGDFTKKGRGVYLRYQGRKKIWRPLRELFEAEESRVSSMCSYIRSLGDEKAALST